MTAQFCQTKTGNKIHARSEGSSRTFCGCKVARYYPNGPGLPNAYTEFCGGCGLNGEVIRKLDFFALMR